MNLSNNCKETFLEGITDAYIYPAKGCILPRPFSVGQILSMDGCRLSKELLHIATIGDDHVVAETLSAKSSPSKVGFGTSFALEISASFTYGKEKLREIQRKIVVDDDNYYVLLQRENGKQFFCYTLPDTFIFNVATSSTQNGEQCTLTILMSSMSDFIPITIDID